MKNIQNRLKKIEEALSVSEDSQKRLCVRVILSCVSDKELLKQLGPVKQWASYKQVEAQYPDEEVMTFMADPELELKARQRQLTKDELAALLRYQPQVA
jgi:hypothetical protein